jgi:hypothetical protein
MKTYWFTIAEGEKHLSLYADLKKSAEDIGLELHKIENNEIPRQKSYSSDEQSALKSLKIDGILQAPSEYDRLVYLDADTLIRNIGGIDQQNGALKEPWGMGDVPLVAPSGGLFKQWNRRHQLWRVLKQNGLEEFCPGREHYRQEWNSGVIIGGHKFLEELAIEWRKWWDIVLNINDGIFTRDQMSFKYAYRKIAIDKYGFETIQPAYNWVVKRLGENRHARIFHRAGISDGKNTRLWQKIRQELFTSDPGTRNMHKTSGANLEKVNRPAAS